MLQFRYKVEKEGDPPMTKLNVNYILTMGGGVNNTLYIIKIIKDYEIAGFNTGYFS